MQPSDDEVFSIVASEYNYPDLYSEYYEYHLHQIGLMSKLIKMDYIEEADTEGVDYRYYKKYDRVKRTRIYKISSSKIDRVYIGSTRNPLICRYLGHLYDAIRAPDTISSYKIIKYGGTRIELLEDAAYTGDDYEVLELEKKHMRLCIDKLVNLQKVHRTGLEYMDDYKEGVELRYYLEVDLTESQENIKISGLLNWYKTKIPDVGYKLSDEGIRKMRKLKDKLTANIREKNAKKVKKNSISTKNDEEISKLLAEF